MAFSSSHYCGTDGWAFNKEHSDLFKPAGSTLVKYAQLFNCVELNSSFYKEHLEKAYVRWANTVPSNFRFSVKLSKTFTHEKRLELDRDLLKKL